MLKKLPLLAVCVVLMGLSGCLSSLTGGGKTLEKDDYRLANAAGGLAADYGANKAGSEVQKKHGAVAGTATKTASGAAGHAAVDATVPAEGPKAKTLVITFNKQGVVRSYRLK